MFKKCSKCESSWQSLNTFLEDPWVVYRGYQASFSSPAHGSFLFHHLRDGCNTTLTLSAGSFVPAQEIQNKIPMGTPTRCPKLCQDGAIEKPEHCPKTCEETDCAGFQIRGVIARLKRKWRARPGSN